MKSFSERKGLKPVSEIIQTGGMNQELRNSLWNTLHIVIWSRNDFITQSNGSVGMIDTFSTTLWYTFFKKPIDQRPGHGQPGLGHLVLKAIHEHFFDCSWNEVYDFLEVVIQITNDAQLRLSQCLNEVLIRELAGYRFVNGIAVDITDEQEVEMLQEVVADSHFSGVSAHIGRALELLADRKKPDYRNSIKESISAVEAMARIITGNQKATLGDALKVLEKSGKLHKSLKNGFTNLYGYTSDADGIRHAMLNESNVTQADAKYFLLSCTSFVNYLKANLE